MGRVFCTAALVALVTFGCSRPPAPVFTIQRNLLTVDNRTARDWLDVEIWINHQYRITAPKIPAGSRFTTTLDVFVAGFGQRFDRRKQRIDDLRLKARQPDGTPGEGRFEDRKGGLAGALEGFGS